MLLGAKSLKCVLKSRVYNRNENSKIQRASRVCVYWPRMCVRADRVIRTDESERGGAQSRSADGLVRSLPLRPPHSSPAATPPTKFAYVFSTPPARRRRTIIIISLSRGSLSLFPICSRSPPPHRWLHITIYPPIRASRGRAVNVPSPARATTSTATPPSHEGLHKGVGARYKRWPLQYNIIFSELLSRAFLIYFSSRTFRIVVKYYYNTHENNSMFFVIFVPAPGPTRSLPKTAVVATVEGSVLFFTLVLLY